MSEFPLSLSAPVRVWRLDDARYATSCDTGIGAFIVGGRWNPKGVHAVYCSLDPATAILEVAVHKGFAAIDMVPHVLSAFEIPDFRGVHVVHPSDVPDPTWLLPGMPYTRQQEFGSHLLQTHTFVAIPSTVSKHSWNLVFDANLAAGQFRRVLQESFALDTRLNPAWL